MNKYLKQYIELQKQFRETEGNPDSVRALYAFKEELEQSEDRQAKEVLVDVYDLLDFKRTPTSCFAKSEIAPIKDSQAAGHIEGLRGELGQSIRHPQAQNTR